MKSIKHLKNYCHIAELSERVIEKSFLLHKEILNCSRKGTFQSVRDLLNEGANLHFISKYMPFTPLFSALEQKNLDVVTLLITRKANLFYMHNDSPQYSQIEEIVAEKLGKVFMKELKDQREEYNKFYNPVIDCSAMNVATRNSNKDLLKRVTNQIIHITKKPKQIDGEEESEVEEESIFPSPLHVACAKKFNVRNSQDESFKIIKHLKKRGANFHRKWKTDLIDGKLRSWTPLKILSADRNCFKELCEVVESEKIDQECIFVAAEFANCEAINLMIDLKRFDLESVKDSEGRNVLWYCDMQNINLWKLLLSRVPSLLLAKCKGKTIVDELSVKSKEGCVASSNLLKSLHI